MTFEHRMRHRDGSWRVLESTASNLLAQPAVAGIVLNAHDVTDRKHAEEKLLHDALHDELTGPPQPGAVHGPPAPVDGALAPRAASG